MADVKTWSQWAGDVSAQAWDLAEDAVHGAMAVTGADVAVDYWSSKSPTAVTKEFRDAADEYVSERLGETTGKAARLAAAPLGAAARFSVSGVQGLDATARRATEIATGRAALPSPGDVIAGTAAGVVATVGQGVDAGIHAAGAGVSALVRGDAEGVARATEDGLKAAFDVGTVVAAGTGVASGVKSMAGPGAVRLAAAGGPSLAAGLATPSVGTLGVSAGTLGVLSQRPMESRGRGQKASAAPTKRPPRRREGLISWPKKRTPGAKPKGPEAKPKRNASADEMRDIELQNQAADQLAEYGFDVEHIPESKIEGVKNPDLKVNGEIFDVYSPRKTTRTDSVRGGIQEKIKSEQTSRVVVNLEDSVSTNVNGLAQALQKSRAQHPGLIEVIVINKGHIKRIFPKG